MPGAAGEYQPIGPGSGGASSGGGGAVNEVINTDGSLTVSPTTGNVVTSNNFANPSATAGPAAVNGSAVTSMRSDAAPAIQLGSATQKGIVQVDGSTITAASGVITAVSGASGANPTATAGPNAVNGSATTFMRSDAAPAIQKASSSQFGIVEVDGNTITSASGIITAVFPSIMPQGRLTLQSGSPVQTADQTAVSTVYYDSYVGNLVPVWNGSQWVYLTIGSNEISMGLDAVTPHVASGSLYDIFAINNSGILVIAIGPAWSSTTSRGTGAGTTQIALKNGIWTNANALTHAWGGASGTTDYGSIAANEATYLGTLYATANGQTGVALLPAAASGGSNTIIGLYNAYNSVRASALSRDSTTSYTYNSTTWRAANNSTGNRVSYVDGLGNIFPLATYGIASTISSTSDNSAIGIVMNATSGTPNLAAVHSSVNNAITSFVAGPFYPALGFNFVQAMEAALVGGTVTFFPHNASNNTGGLTVETNI